MQGVCAALEKRPGMGRQGPPSFSLAPSGWSFWGNPSVSGPSTVLLPSHLSLPSHLYRPHAATHWNPPSALSTPHPGPKPFCNCDTQSYLHLYLLPYKNNQKGISICPAQTWACAPCVRLAPDHTWGTCVGGSPLGIQSGLDSARLVGAGGGAC